MRNAKLYQLYDLKAESVGGPIMAQKAPGPAIRDFHSVLANPETQPGRYPQDFNLIQIGEQDETTGRIIDTEVVIVATGEAWVQQRNLELLATNGESHRSAR